MHLKILSANGVILFIDGDNTSIISYAELTASYYELILGLCPTNERRRYIVTASFIGWGQA